MCPKCGAKFGEMHGPECLKELNATPRSKAPVKCMITEHDSMAFGVHRTQVADTREVLKKNGIPTDIKPDGTFRIKSRDHQAKLCRFFNRNCPEGGMYHNKDGGYGDG